MCSTALAYRTLHVNSPAYLRPDGWVVNVGAMQGPRETLKNELDSKHLDVNLARRRTAPLCHVQHAAYQKRRRGAD